MEGREPSPLVRRALAVNLAPLTIAVGRVGIHGLAYSLMGLVGMGLWETGFPRRNGRTPWAIQLSYQPVSRANSQGRPVGMALGSAGPAPASSSGAARGWSYAPNSTMVDFISNSAILSATWSNAALTDVLNDRTNARKMAEFGTNSDIGIMGAMVDHGRT